MKGMYRKTFFILVFLFAAVIVMVRVEVLRGDTGPRKGSASQKQPRRVPAISNESIVTGEVLGYSVVSSSLLDMQPLMPVYRLEVVVKTSEEVKGMRSFTRDKVGKLLSLYSKEKLSVELFSKIIKAHVSYQGDEKGGMFWIKEFEVLGAKQITAP
jgi:hypothetical protein